MKPEHDTTFSHIILPCTSGTPRGLAVLLHGHGDNAEDLGTVAKALHAAAPDADVMSIHGPIVMDIPFAFRRRQGIPLDKELRTWMKVESLPRLVLGAAFNRMAVKQALNAFIDDELVRRGLSRRNLAVFGFSLGAGVAAEVALDRKESCAALVCHSSTISPFTRLRARPDTLLVIGDEDFLYKPDPRRADGEGNIIRKLLFYSEDKPGAGIVGKAFHAVAERCSLYHSHAVARLERRGVTVTEAVIPGLGHKMDSRSVESAASFMAAGLRAAERR